MKIGPDLLLWTPHVTEEHLPARASPQRSGHQLWPTGGAFRPLPPMTAKGWRDGPAHIRRGWASA